MSAIARSENQQMTALIPPQGVKSGDYLEVARKWYCVRQLAPANVPLSVMDPCLCLRIANTLSI
jgi:hypothetical protein